MIFTDVYNGHVKKLNRCQPITDGFQDYPLFFCFCSLHALTCMQSRAVAVNNFLCGDLLCGLFIEINPGVTVTNPDMTSGTRETMIYLKATRNMQCYFFYVGSREGFQAILPPLLYQVIQRLLSSVLHGQTLWSIFGRGEGTKPLMLGKGHRFTNLDSKTILHLYYELWQNVKFDLFYTPVNTVLR